MTWLHMRMLLSSPRSVTVCPQVLKPGVKRLQLTPTLCKEGDLARRAVVVDVVVVGGGGRRRGIGVGRAVVVGIRHRRRRRRRRTTRRGRTSRHRRNSSSCRRVSSRHVVVLVVLVVLVLAVVVAVRRRASRWLLPSCRGRGSRAGGPPAALPRPSSAVAPTARPLAFSRSSPPSQPLARATGDFSRPFAPSTVPPSRPLALSEHDRASARDGWYRRLRTRDGWMVSSARGGWHRRLLALGPEAPPHGAQAGDGLWALVQGPRRRLDRYAQSMVVVTAPPS